jgi:hypothetical protein
LFSRLYGLRLLYFWLRLQPGRYGTAEFIKEIGNIPNIISRLKEDKFAYVNHYGQMKRYLYISVISLIILIFINFLVPSTVQFYFLYPMQVLILNLVFWSIFYLLLYAVQKDFRFVFAKAYVTVASKYVEYKGKDDMVDRLRYLMRGLDSYNDYLRKQLGLQISDLKRIYSKIGCLPQEERKSEITTIHNSFNNIDRLEPLNHISAFMEMKTEQFLSKESLAKKGKDWITIAISALTVLITVFQLLFVEKK